MVLAGSVVPIEEFPATTSRQRMHEFGGDCWCRPRYRVGDGHLIHANSEPQPEPPAPVEPPPDDEVPDEPFAEPHDPEEGEPP